ncbi:arginine/serine-rich protein PNISR-like isoform X2 [Zophobas morio]|uniref:arginine/serine-rich protein PNISR-like isoform X2 n=1 Tax=Zophobas morio TaxID=2755281 RepID=UPI0030827529
MYSGSDSTESQNYSQWALNPSTYQSMSNEQVDWAALAQQWIIMKEAGPPPVMSSESPKLPPKKEQLNEGGEAPMDVENEKEESASDWNPVPNQQTNNWSWNAQSQTWGWNNAWTPPTGVPPPAPLKPPLLPTPSNYNQFSAPPDSGNDNANFPGSGYWTSAGSSKQIKPHNRRFSKVNVPRPVQPVVTEAPPALDASKRKQLPAWIREGLEKMERDKQKQLEREKEKQEREEYNEKLKQNEKETMEILKSTIKEQQRSKFESDGDYSDEEVPERKKVVQHPEPVPLTPAEQMMNVRRTMTEILLKVTNREIELICREELQRHHKKRKASDQRVSAPSGANVTAKLGLGIYGGGSGSSSSGESDEENGEEKDSDTELKDSIKRKKAEFSKTEREIEDKLAEAESRKQEAVSRSPSPDTNDNDTQVDAKVQDTPGEPRPLHVAGNRKRRSLSDSKSSVKRTKSRSSSSSSDDASSYSRKHRGSGHRSSTSSSGGHDAKKASKRGRSRSRTRSRTPDKSRHKSVKAKAKRSRSRSTSKQRKGRYARRSRSRSSSYRRRRSRSGRRSRSPYAKSRRSRSRSRSRRRRSRSSSSGRGKRSHRR